MAKQPETKTEWYKRHFIKLGNRYQCHWEQIQYMSAKHHFNGFTRENLITHCETRFVQYPHVFSHKRYFYLSVATFLRSITDRQFESIIKQPNVPENLLGIEKIVTPINGDLKNEENNDSV